MGREHRYALTVEWTGNQGEGTASYRSYTRDHDVTGENLTPIAGSADPAFRGNPSRWNPEQLLLASASQCHMDMLVELILRECLLPSGTPDFSHPSFRDRRRVPWRNPARACVGDRGPACRRPSA